MQRTQALSENTFYKYKGDRRPNFAKQKQQSNVDDEQWFN